MYKLDIFVVALLLKLLWTLSIAKQADFNCTGIYKHFPNEDVYDPVQLLKELVVISSVIPLTKYRLYTRQNPDNFHTLRPGDVVTVRSSYYKGDLPTKFIVHGFRQTADDDWVQMLKSSLLSYGDYNIIIVDWSEAARVHFPYSVLNIHRISTEVTWMIKYLKEVTSGDLKKFHLIGSDLGAHINSFVGKQINKLGRITGLDPSGSGFKTYPPEFRLDNTDATFVDVIHTNGEEYFRGYGLPQAIGNFDFYPNGGVNQPGCLDKIVDAASKQKLQNAQALARCSHHWAESLFSDALLNPTCQYVGYTCTDWDTFLDGKCASCGSDGTDCAIMGIQSDSCCTVPHDGIPRKYYFKTNPHWPYCLYHYQVLVKLGNFPASERQYGQVFIRLKGEKNEMSAQLSKSTESFIPGELYTYLVTNPENLGPIISAHVFWIRSTFRVYDTKTPRISIDYIQITPMSILKRETNDGKITILYGNVREVIPPGLVLNITRRI
ncbi:pancreatic triacylglycerol lipase-like [Centruroides vittatus]|uniref:pancreatic triacylglycerol lipase-like n=1 Tax=Centruroides vittatus TaxID=120091 RepID=UPI0035100EF4